MIAAGTLRDAVQETKRRVIADVVAADPRASRQELADRLGISITSFLGLAKRFGIAPPPPSKPWRLGRRLGAEQTAVALEMHKTGATMDEIATRLRVSHQAISALAKRAWWPPRPHRCDATCRSLLSRPAPVDIGAASRDLGIQAENLRRRLRIHHPDVTIMVATLHRCSDQCRQLSEALLTASSYGEAVRRAGWKGGAAGVVQRYRIYHPGFAWERAKGLPGGRPRTVDRASTEG